MQNKIRKNFSQLPNGIIEDPGVSTNSKALFWYLASRPDDWIYLNSDIRKVLGIKDRHTIAKYLRELMEKGWIERIAVRDEGGKMSGNYDYVINESPFSAKNDAQTPKPAQSRSVKKPHFGNVGRSVKFSQMGKNHTYNNTDINKQYESLFLRGLESETLNESETKTKPPKNSSRLSEEILSLPLPDCVSFGTWKEFVSNRLEKSKKWSLRGAKMLLSKLQTFPPGVREDALKESVIRNWDSVWEPKEAQRRNPADSSDGFAPAGRAPINPFNPSTSAKESALILKILRDCGKGLLDVISGRITHAKGKPVEAFRDSRGRYWLRFKSVTGGMQ